MRITVYAPVNTKEVLLTLRDAEPEAGVKFSLYRRKGALLVFDVSTGSTKQACGLAETLLKEKGLADLPGLAISPTPEEKPPGQSI